MRKTRADHSHGKPSPGDPPRFLDRAALADRQLAALRRLLDAVVGPNPFWTEKFAAAGLTAADIRTLADLPRLPFTTKTQVAADQAAKPPYGTNLTFPLKRYVRMHQTSGTTGQGMRWLDTPESWDWFVGCWSTIYDVVALKPDDRLYFAFSFGPFIGFWAAFEGAQRRGNFCLAGGGLSSSARLRAMLDNRATALLCTPTYALHLAETAQRESLDLRRSAVRMLIVAGEPGGSVPGVRARLEAAFDARVFDHTGMTETGPLGIECVEAPGCVHLLESEAIVELVDPSADTLLFSPGVPGRDTAPDPIEGELVLTNLGRLGSPLLRYRTGDVVRLRTGRCACGRSLVQMVGGILGRCDDMIIVRGNNVYPAAIDSIVREFDSIAEYRIILDTRAGLTDVTLEIEPVAGAAGAASALADRVAETIKSRLFFHAHVRVAPSGSLPRFEMKARRIVRAPPV
ncbi:MAG: Phenylacetate-coenzyme A ligase [Phycisphaerae bacterium]|nr:Phenylacetate-coenzyme A ligase [Phycisphaerae bacterium]